MKKAIISAVALIVAAPLFAQAQPDTMQQPAPGGMMNQGGQPPAGQPGPGAWGGRRFRQMNPNGGPAGNPNGGPAGQGNMGIQGGGMGMQGNNSQQAARRQKMMQRFDANHDGSLDDNERAQMRAFMQQRRQQRQAMGGGQGFGGQGFNGMGTTPGTNPMNRPMGNPPAGPQ